MRGGWLSCCRHRNEKEMREGTVLTGWSYSVRQSEFQVNDGEVQGLREVTLILGPN